MIPYIGETVHYHSHGTPIRNDGTQAYKSLCRAAIVTELNDPDTTDPDLMSGPCPSMTVGLMVANPTGQFFHSLGRGGVWWDYAADDTAMLNPITYTPGTWHRLH